MATDISPRISSTKTRFSMFGGPDFLYVDQFFPSAAVRALRKEALGPPPDPLRIANLSGALGKSGKRDEVFAQHDGFITKDMKVDLHEQNLNGVLPILYTCIARADKSITNVSFGSLNSGGVFEKPRRAEKAVLLECVFVTPTTNPAVHRRYIISPPIFLTAASSDSRFPEVLPTPRHRPELLKSPSYLLFESGFATIQISFSITAT